jgi:small-conductance mechanosensitive channel
MIPPWRRKSEPGREGRPPDRGPGSGKQTRRAGLGLLLIAIGRREGLQDFGNTTEAYLASLAPLVAFALVSTVLAAAAGQVHVALLGFLLLICSWLAPAVISHPLCRRWGKQDAWPRYANILNWGQMLMFLVFSVGSAAARAAIAAGLPANPTLVVAGGAVLIYAIWFQWFVARGVVQVSRWRTVLLILAVMAGTNLLLSIPLLASGNSLQEFMK